MANPLINSGDAVLVVYKEKLVDLLAHKWQPSTVAVWA